MPYYDFRCQSCGRRAAIYIAYSDYDSARPVCPHCASDSLKRLISRVTLAKSDDARVEAMMDDPSMAGLDDEDPRALGRFMRKMSREMGEDMGEEFDEVVDRLEKGESPESIEASMPDLGDDI